LSACAGFTGGASAHGGSGIRVGAQCTSTIALGIRGFDDFSWLVAGGMTALEVM